MLATNSSFSFIAKTLSVSVSTISREIKRNSWRKKYRPKEAQELADGRKKRILYYLTEEQWSPKQISGYLKKEGINVSHKYIYQIIRADKEEGGTLYTHLRHKGKHRKRPVGKCPQIPDRICIHERPVEANGKRVGDFELDTIIGKDGKGAIVTLVDRKTNYMMMKKSRKGKEAEEVAQIVRDLLFPYRHYVKTITTDNGSEFCDHRKISQALGATVYFADPYSSWQKGCIWNTNKLIRQYIPKGLILTYLRMNKYCRFNIKSTEDPEKN